MSTGHFNKLCLFPILLLGPFQAGFAACDQTLSPGAYVAAAISSAAAGTTICLNPGRYGRGSISNVVKTGDVTVQSVSGKTASLSLKITGSNHLKFQNLTISGLDMWSGGNKNISVLNNTFTGQMLITGSGRSATPANVVIDGNTFDGISVCSNCYEGRLQIYNGGGVTVSNNHFGGSGQSDGIQMGGYGGVIGPGNIFQDLRQGNYGRHVDAIQLYGEVASNTVTGNYFYNDSIYIGAYDGGSNVNITNNVFGPSSDSGQKVPLGAIQGGSYVHNTMIGNSVNQGAKNGMPRNVNFAYRNNIFVNSSIVDSGDQPGCASGCVYEYNLFTSRSSARGSNNIIGNPTFIGGSNPSTWAGYQLAEGSLGYKSGSDGADRGANFFGGSPVATLAAPTNLRVVQ